ncbi:MAG: cytochrome c peroxidase [Terracidiphilus sp.]
MDPGHRQVFRLFFLAAALAAAVALLSGCGTISFDPRPSADIAPERLFMFTAVQAPAPATGLAAMRVDLGRRLFYDTHLSVNNSISCNTCHQLKAYGVDPGESVSTGHDKKPGGRNSPTVYNAGLQFAQFWDGRAATLAEQAAGPMMNPVEMGMPDAATVLAYLHSSPDYIKQFKQAYPDAKDPVVMDNVTDAIATFESGLITPSRWDKYLQGNTNALSGEEKTGLRVFLRSGCASCHAGKGLGGNSYQKLGAYRDWPTQDSDIGRMALTHQAADLLYFKVPLLRNVTETGPWFHDGHVKTIDEAVRLMGHYQAGRGLSEDDVRALVAFLGSLKGDIPHQYIQPPSAKAPPVRTALTQGTSRQRIALVDLNPSKEGQ